MSEESDFSLSPRQLTSLFRYAYTLCDQRDEANDLLQASVEKYLIQVKQHRVDIHSVESYLRTLIRNRFIDGQRYRQRWDTEPYQELDTYDIGPHTLEQVYINKDSLLKIWSCLEPCDRDILYHTVVLGLTADEACVELGMRRGTLLSRIHRLRKQFTTTAEQVSRGDEHVYQYKND